MKPIISFDPTVPTYINYSINILVANFYYLVYNKIQDNYAKMSNQKQSTQRGKRKVTN